MSGFFPFSLIRNIGGGFFGAKLSIPPVLQTFAAGPFTWVKPTAPVGLTIKSFTVKVKAGGGGGQSAVAATNSFGGAANGGDGGSGSGYATATYLPGALPATVSGTVGTGGAGGASPGTAAPGTGGSAGNPGVNGTDSNFGAFITATHGIGGGASGWPIAGGSSSGTVAGTGAPTAVLVQTGGAGGDGNWPVTHPACDGAVPTLAGAGGGSGGRQVNGGTIGPTGNSRGIGTPGVQNTPAEPGIPSNGAGGGCAITNVGGYNAGLNSAPGANAEFSGDGGGGSGCASGFQLSDANITGAAGGKGADGSIIVITNFVQS